MSGRDAAFMRRALELAACGWGRVSPNPMVGALVVRAGRIVGEGHHAEFGGEHAEVAALSAAGDAARGATLYVSLEPCDHRGKTPPCTETILASGVARVVYACRDPDRASGSGAARLRAAGLEVRGGVGAAAARRLNAPFFWRHAGDGDGTPFVALKLALSLDGQIAARRGERTTVTGEEAWRAVHRLRAGFDGVLIGRGTAEVDDPLLTARGEPGPRRPPTRVVLDSRLRLDPGSALARTAREAPVWAVCLPRPDRGRRRRLEALGVRVLEAPPAPEGGVALEATARRLAGEGIGSLLVEGGGRVAAAFLASGLPRRLYLLYAPVLYGHAGVPAFPDASPEPPGRWHPTERRELGRDTLLVLEREELAAELTGKSSRGRWARRAEGAPAPTAGGG